MLSAAFLPQIGGVETQLRGLSAALVARGYSVRILTRRLGVEPVDDVIEGVPVHRVRLLHSSRTPASISFLSGGLLWLARRAGDFEIFHCHQAYSAATLAVIAKSFARKAKVIVKVTTAGKLSEMSAVTRELPFSSVRLRLLRGVDAFVAMTEEIAREIEAAGVPRSKIVRIPNGVALPDAQDTGSKARLQARRSLGLDWERIAVYVGRLATEKGLPALLRAWQRAVQGEQGWGLILVGDGGPVRSVEEELRELARSLRLSSVVFTGRLGDVRPALAASDLLVLPSLSEGMSNALLEGMAFARAAVVSDLPGNRELVEQEVSGLLVPPGDEEGLSLALQRLLSRSEEARRMGAAARSRVQRNFSFARVCALYERLYAGLLQGQVPEDRLRPACPSSGDHGSLSRQ